MSVNGVRCIFIIGMNGSGTHMLADCLNNHPLIYVHKREIRTLPYYYFSIAKYGDLKNENNFRRLLEDFSSNPGFLSINNYKPLEIPINFNTTEEKNLSKIIDLTYSFFASRVNKPIWGDHSPKYAVFIPEIIDLFPRAKIIHIIRDGRDCAQSFNRRFGQSIYRTVFLWKKLVKKARVDGFAAGVERYFEIRYEELTNSPEYYMKKICSFLEVPFDSGILDSNMPMYSGETSSGGRGIIVSNSGNWRNRFTNNQIKKLEDIAGDTLANLGYEIMFSSGDHDLSNIKLRFLKYLDNINACISVISQRKDLLFSNIGAFIKIIKRSLKQNKYFKY